MEKIKHEFAAIYVLWLRQIKRHSRSRSRLFMSVFQPLLFLISFGFGFRNMYANAGQGNYIDFLAPGIVMMSVVFSAMFAGIEVISDKQFGFLKETLVAPISRWSIIFGRTLGGATTAMIQGVLVLVISLAVGFKPEFAVGILPALLFMFLIAILFTAFGSSVATFFSDMHAFPVIINVIVMPMFFLSGALFPLNGLPDFFAKILNFNPLVYGVDGLRGSLTGVFHYSFGLDLGILAILVVLILWLGAWLFSRVEG